MLLMCETPLLCLLIIFAIIPANRCDDCLESSESSTAKQNHKDVSQKTEEINPATIINDNVDFIESSIHFAYKFHHILKADKEKKGENFIMYPNGLFTELYLFGHASVGKIQEEIQSVLKLRADSSTIGKFKKYAKLLDCVTSYCAYFKSIYLINQRLEKSNVLPYLGSYDYAKEMLPCPFCDRKNAEDAINSWVAGSTQNNIQTIINFDDTDFNTGIISLSAVYVKYTWKHHFIKSKTSTQKFFALGSNEYKHDVDMMYVLNKFRHKSFEDLKASIIEIPYKSDEFVMLVVIPHEIDGLKDVEEKLKSRNLRVLRDSLVEDYVELYLPKFRVETVLNVESLFKKIGVKTMFTLDASFKDFSYPESAISLMRQKLVLKVDEMGDEAESGVESPVQVSSNNVPVFRVDRPFHFQIIKNLENNNYLLDLLGNVYDVEHCNYTKPAE